jgi:NAD(P)-dependent dehydrogenase (short-subunit alcohol dehydrogenase family)
MASEITRVNLKRINRWVSCFTLLQRGYPYDISGRLGDALDMGGTILFLASRAASHITDAKFVIDGGSLICLAGTRARL